MLNNITFFTDKFIDPNSSIAVNIRRYGLMFIFENGSAGCYGIFGVVGATLYKIASLGYATDDSTSFKLSLDEDGLHIQNKTSSTTKHSFIIYAGT